MFEGIELKAVMKVLKISGAVVALLAITGIVMHSRRQQSKIMALQDQLLKKTAEFNAERESHIADRAAFQKVADQVEEQNKAVEALRMASAASAASLDQALRELAKNSREAAKKQDLAHAEAVAALKKAEGNCDRQVEELVTGLKEPEWVKNWGND